MARIKINDLPKDMKIRKDEMKQIFGGLVASKYIGETEKNLLDPQGADPLGSAADDSQLANIDLQNQLQKQQQIVQMLSNTSKLVHDTATAVIRKIG